MRVVIIGQHPIIKDLVRQYKCRDYKVVHYPDGIFDADELRDMDEVVLLADDDNVVLGMMVQVSEKLDMEARNGRKLTCHLLLHSQAMLQMLHTNDLNEEIRKKMDVYPFTLNDVWSRNIVLDHEAITIQSEKIAHLVVFGMGDMAEAVAINAALVAHYPNYTRNHSLRTRITIVDENLTSKYHFFIAKYKHLFDNSYYRVVCPQSAKVVTEFHKPMYSDSREDFVDVEWEFVEASVYDKTLREKLQLWATGSRQVLTIAFTHTDEECNLADVQNLPDSVHSVSVPIYVYMRDASIMRLVEAKGKLANVIPFGMSNCGYDIRMPLVQMAKTVNYIYDAFYNDNFGNYTDKMLYTVEVDRDKRDMLWQDVTAVKRMSNIYNAMAIPTKMRSVGLQENEWDKFYDIPQQDIELLAEVEHNRWTVEELILGWRPCTQDEQQRIEADISLKADLKKQRIHYDLRAYGELRPDETGKSVKIYDRCLCAGLPLIAKTYAEEKGGKG